MRRTSTVYTKIIDGLEEKRFEELYHLFSTTPYQEGKGYGFTLTDVDGDLLFSTLIYKRISYNKVFDTETQNFEQREVTVFDTIPITVDLQHHALEVFSSVSQLKLVIAVLNSLAPFRLRIEEFPVSPPTALDKLKQAGHTPVLQRVIIDNFVAIPGTSGRYNATVGDSSSGYKLIELQRKDVRQVSFSIDLRIEENIEVTLNRNGGWKLRCDEDHTTEVITTLLEMLLQEGTDG